MYSTVLEFFQHEARQRQIRFAREAREMEAKKSSAKPRPIAAEEEAKCSQLSGRQLVSSTNPILNLFLLLILTVLLQKDIGNKTIIQLHNAYYVVAACRMTSYMPA